MFAALVLCGCAICFSSCSKEDDECTCTGYEYGVEAEQSKVLPEKFGAKNCKDLAKTLTALSDGEVDFTCK